MSPTAPARPLRLGILLSGRGSNFLAIARNIRSGALPGVEIALVLSNVADAPGIQAARDLGLPAADLHLQRPPPRRPRPRHARPTPRRDCADLVILAGYMRLLSPEFILAYPQPHPQHPPIALPAFPGLDAQQQAFDYGVQVAGCTVHFVDEHLDHGVIILQRAIPVLPADDAHTLAERILAEEHIAYSEAIARVASGQYEIQGRRYVLRADAPPSPAKQ